MSDIREDQEQEVQATQLGDQDVRAAQPEEAEANWIPAVEDQLSDWRRRARESQHSHHEAAKYYARLNYWLGIPIVALSSLVGTTVFATLESQPNTTIRVIVGFMSALVALLGGIQTFLGLGQKGGTHRMVAARYGSVRSEIEQILALSPAERGRPREVLDKVREKRDALATEAPEVPNKIWNRAVQIMNHPNNPNE